MANKGLTVRVEIEGGREALRAFRRLPKAANDALRVRSRELAETLAGRIQAAARSDSSQAALLAGTVKATRDRVPAVVAGGTKRVGSRQTPAWQILFVAEFGSNQRSGWYALPRFDSSTGSQFRPHVGKGSYWFFKAVGDNKKEIGKAWKKAAADIEKAFVQEGGG